MKKEISLIFLTWSLLIFGCSNVKNTFCKDGFGEDSYINDSANKYKTSIYTPNEKKPEILPKG